MSNSVFYFSCGMSSGKNKRNQVALNMLGQNIRKYRKMRSLTINDLAYKLDVDYSQIGRMELGKINFSVSLLFDVAEALNIAPGDLLQQAKEEVE